MKLREKEYERLTAGANARLEAGDSREDTLKWLNYQVKLLVNACIRKKYYNAPDTEKWKDRLEGAEAARDDFAANNL